MHIILVYSDAHKMLSVTINFYLYTGLLLRPFCPTYTLYYLFLFASFLRLLLLAKQIIYLEAIFSQDF